MTLHHNNDKIMWLKNLMRAGEQKHNSYEQGNNVAVYVQGVLRGGKASTFHNFGGASQHSRDRKVVGKSVRYINACIVFLLHNTD